MSKPRQPNASSVTIPKCQVRTCKNRIYMNQKTMPKTAAQILELKQIQRGFCLSCLHEVPGEVFEK